MWLNRSERNALKKNAKTNLYNKQIKLFESIK